MKMYLIETLVIFLLVVFFPFLSLVSDKGNDANYTEISETTIADTSESDKTNENRTNEEVDVLRVSSGKVETVSKTEYLIGVVASEMPASFHDEALKAQTVASNTYLKWIQSNKDEDNNEDISDSGSTHQSYLSKTEMKEKWGDNFDKYYSKLEQIVKEVDNEYLTYNGEVALTVFHALSSGITNSAKDVWDKDIPYLVSVSAPGDMLSSDLDSSVSYTNDEFNSLVKEKLEIESTENEDDSPLSIIDSSESGYVTAVTIYGETFTGNQIKDALSLKSPNFTVEIADNSINFLVKGKGHGVGMSQYSADFMARQGSDYKEILLHFYKGTEIATE